jgi:sulfatase modifying factor 1
MVEISTIDGDVHKGMVSIPGGCFEMGSDKYYEEERPAHKASVEPFLIDRFAVNNHEFEVFIQDTKYVTTAEIQLDQNDATGMEEEYIAAGSLVFVMTEGPVPLNNFNNWWHFVPGACWRHPEGPESTIEGREDHPVVHVSHFDAAVYAAWAGKSLPTEKEWEFAARAGSTSEFPWGNDLFVEEKPQANTWLGEFPWRNDRVKSGDVFTVPVDAFDPSKFGTFNMIGNVWEWTSNQYQPNQSTMKSCCTPQKAIHDSTMMVLKGGSCVCSPSYCERYRPASRSFQESRGSSSHIGFRCVIRRKL